MGKTPSIVILRKQKASNCLNERSRHHWYNKCFESTSSHLRQNTSESAIKKNMFYPVFITAWVGKAKHETYTFVWKCNTGKIFVVWMLSKIISNIWKNKNLAPDLNKCFKQDVLNVHCLFFKQYHGYFDNKSVLKERHILRQVSDTKKQTTCFE